MSDVFYVGGREYKRSPNQFEIVREGDWILHGTGFSPCGRFENYKLYLSGSSSRKRVFYISKATSDGRFVQTGDQIILQQDFEGMQQWVEGALGGKRVNLPEFPSSVIRRKRKPPRPAVRPDDVGMEIILSHIGNAEREGKHLSIFSQTLKQGRYAPSVIAKATGLRQRDIVAALEYMVIAGIVETVMICTKTKKRGLRVAKSMEIDNG